MRAAKLFTLSVLVLAASQAAAACTPLRLGYVNQHRPPYFFGTGSTELSAPGASVDLVREIAASAACEAVLVRLPPLRLKQALDTGGIDAMLMDARESDVLAYALPVARNGQADPMRALRMYTVVFVRAADKLPPETDPASYFALRKLGINNGASLAAHLRTLGFTIDDGAVDAGRNLEKLVRKRIDGYGASLVVPEHMDSRIAAMYDKQVVRLATPLRTHHLWLAFSKPYYQRNRSAVEAMWDWMGAHGNERFVELVKKYETAP